MLVLSRLSFCLAVRGWRLDNEGKQNGIGHEMYTVLCVCSYVSCVYMLVVVSPCLESTERQQRALFACRAVRCK